MPQPRQNRNPAGGHRSRPKGGAHSVTSLIRPDERRPVVRESNVKGREGEPSRECPTCHNQIPLKMDGSLRSHKVTNAWNQSWPCKGEDEGTL